MKLTLEEKVEVLIKRVEALEKDNKKLQEMIFKEEVREALNG